MTIEGIDLDSWRLELTGATEGIDIDLGDGDDTLYLSGFVTGDVTVITGAGDYRVYFGGRSDALGLQLWQTQSLKLPMPTRITGNLSVDTGAGADTLRAFAFVLGDANIQLGADDDMLDEQPLQYFPSHWGIDPVSTVLQVDGSVVIGFGTDEEGLPDPLTEAGSNPPTTASDPIPPNVVVPPDEIQPPVVPAPPPGLHQPPLRSGVLVDNPSIYTYTKVSPELVEVGHAYFLYGQNPQGPFVPPPGVETQNGRIRVEVTTTGTTDDLLAALTRIGLEFQLVPTQKAVGWLSYGRLHSLEALDEVEWVSAAPAEFVGLLEFSDE